MDMYFLWGVRLAVVFLLLGVLLPGKKKKTLLSKAIKKRNSLYTGVEKNKLVKMIEDITEKEFFKPLEIKDGSDEHMKLEEKILQAGGLWGITPNIIQFFRVVLPAMGFLITLGIYITRQAVVSVSLTPSAIEKIIEEQNMFGFLQAKVDPVAISQQGLNISPIAIVWILILSLVLYFLPELFINSFIKKRKELMSKELLVIETFIVIMLETGSHTVYDVLTTLLDTTKFFKPYITMCLNEYYVDPNRAIQNMSDRVKDEEFQIVCNGLKQAVDSDKKHTAMFMKQHLEQIKKIRDLQREANIKKKPLLYVLLLALPLLSIVVIWFFPWLTKAMNMLNSGF